MKAFDRKLGQWLANQRQELVCGTSMLVEGETSLESLPGLSRFAEKLASPKDLAASKGAGAGKGSKPHVHNGLPKPAARGSCGPGDMPGQPLGKRLRVKTSVLWPACRHAWLREGSEAMAGEYMFLVNATIIS